MNLDELKAKIQEDKAKKEEGPQLSLLQLLDYSGPLIKVLGYDGRPTLACITDDGRLSPIDQYGLF